MSENEARQSKIPDEPEYSPFRVQPLEQVLRQGGTSENVIGNYQVLLRHDMHLAELLRLSSVLTDDTRVADLTEKQKKRLVNPFQARVDRKNRVWVDVMFERREHVTIRQLRNLMKVHARARRLVSGSVLAENLPDLVRLVRRLRTARPITSQLCDSVPLIKADQSTLKTAFPQVTELNGSQTIIGIVDIGCDFNHRSFVQGNQSRILFLWDQNGKNGRGRPKPRKKNFKYGVEYTREKINEALGNADPYAYLGYKPDNSTYDGLHGTHVMDIAAGNSDWPGVAPAADVIFVHLGNLAASEEDELKSMGSSKPLFDAVMYIFDKVDEINKKLKRQNPNALEIPVVINISYGSNGGAHDGTSALESMFDDQLNAKPGRAIVMAAGNNGITKGHTSGTINPGQECVIEWSINERRAPDTWNIRQELEIWYEKSAELRVELEDPDRQSMGSCALGQSQAATALPNLSLPAIISHLPPDPEPGEDANHIDILLDNRVPSLKLGTWFVKLRNVSNTPANYNAWVEDNISFPSTLSDSETRTTLNAIGNAALPILVGACANDSSLDICNFSGAGPSLNQKLKEKPDLVAPGLNVFAAEALSRDGRISRTGTSMAAPHITGVIALMFQAARTSAENKRVLSIREIRRILMDTAISNAEPGYDPKFGYGIVNTIEALKKIKIK